MPSEEKFRAVYEALNARWAQGGRNRVPHVFELMIEGYSPHDGFSEFPARLDYESSQTTVQFGRKRFLFDQQNVLDVLTAIAHRDRQIAELEIELERAHEANMRAGVFRPVSP